MKNEDEFEGKNKDGDEEKKKEEDEGEKRKENVKGRDVVVVMKLEEDEE